MLVVSPFEALPDVPFDAFPDISFGVFLVCVGFSMLAYRFVWYLRLQHRQRPLDLHCDTLWLPKQLKHNLSRFVISKHCCRSFTLSQFTGV